MRLRLVMALVIGPLVCLAAYFAWHEVREQKGYADRSEIASRLAADASIIADLVHELQKERGYSAGFIASRGSNFPDALAEQRGFTTAAMDAMNAQLDLVFETRPELIAEAQQQLSQLGDIRGDVDRFALSVPQMAQYYTSTINALFDAARPSAVSGASDTLQLLKVSRALLGAAKESAGLERAMGATGLGGGFSPIIYNRFVSLSGRQMALLDEANGLLSGQKWLQDLLESEEYAAISQARKTVKSGFQTEVFPGLTAPKWFETSTRWINLLREKEIQLTSQINSMSLSAYDDAQDAYWNLIYLAAVSVALTVLLAVVVFERTIRRITGLTNAIDNFTRGDFETEISGTEGADEISKMAKSVSEFKQETLDMRAKAEALEQEQKDRSKQQDFVVEELRNGLSQLSEGDLTTQIGEKFPDAYETLRADFNETVLKLMETMSTIVETAGSIRNGAMEISQASDDLSQRTEKQAITLEETASALDGLASSVKSAAERARSAEGTAGDTKSDALQGGGVVSEAVDAMAQIEDSSNQIVQIIGVIDDIAFQTNLLALNAGVEAARAGEAGRGFAVVAGEVHALAQRSSNAASEIKTLIGESASQVEKGVDLVRKAGEALTGIVERVGEVSSLVSEIAEGAAEQSSGLGEINTGVGQLERVTQQNAGMAEEASAASTLLRSDATKLDKLVQSFKTSEDRGIDESEKKVSGGEDDKAAA